MCFSVFGTLGEALAQSFLTYILHETLRLMFDIIRNVGAPSTHISENWSYSTAWVPLLERGCLCQVCLFLCDENETT